MIIDARQFFEVPGSKREFCFSFSMRDVSSWQDSPVGMIDVAGALENRAGIVTIDCDADYTIDTLCDRCLNEFVRHERQNIRKVAVLSLSEEDNGDYLVCENGMIDAAELVREEITVSLPMVVLCGSNDCAPPFYGQ